MPKSHHKTSKSKENNQEKCNYNPTFFNEVNVKVEAPVTQTTNVNTKEDGCTSCFKALFKAFK